LEKKRKIKEQAQQPLSLHGRLDTPNSWKIKKKKNEPIAFLHKSQTNVLNSGKEKKKPGSLLSWKISHT